MAGRPATTKPTESGARLAQLRLEASMTQSQLAKAVDIPARSISFYERKANSIPSHLVIKLANALNVSPEAILGTQPKTSKAKRGPKSDVEKRLELIKELPKSAQKRILSVVDAMLAQEAS